MYVCDMSFMSLNEFNEYHYCTVSKVMYVLTIWLYHLLEFGVMCTNIFQ